MATTAKTKTAKTAAQDAFAIPGIPAMEVPPAIRDIAENTVAQSKEAFEKIKTSAEEATTLLNETADKTRDGLSQFNEKAIDVAKTNTDATFSHAKNVMAVTSLAEVFELQTAFMKTQIDAIQDQAKVFQDMTAKLTEDTTAPYKEAFEKTAQSFKVA
ncbi:MAG: phasin family protein [Hyphomicrobiales bacterium]